MTDIQQVREALEASLVWRASALHKFHRPAVEKALAALSRLEAAAVPEPTRSQKLRDAGYTRRPTWRSFPHDDDIAVPELSREAVVRLARQAGFHFHDAGHAPILHTDPLEYSERCFQRFAALVRSAPTCKQSLQVAVPVGEAKPVCETGFPRRKIFKWFQTVPQGTLLYTTQPAPIEGWRMVPVEALTRWRDAFAEELAAWDIDPPLHHVKTSHDEIDAMLAASPKVTP